MKLIIEVKGEKPEVQLLHLKKFLENSKIKEMDSIQINKSESVPGEMGVGAMGSLTAILVGALNPFSRFAEAFSNYASSFRTELILKNEYGDELVLNTKKIDKEGINYLVEQFLNKQSTKRSNVTRTKKTK